MSLPTFLQKKEKKRFGYTFKKNAEVDAADLQLYEPVERVPPFSRKTLVSWVEVAELMCCAGASGPPWGGEEGPGAQDCAARSKAVRHHQGWSVPSPWEGDDEQTLTAACCSDVAATSRVRGGGQRRLVCLQGGDRGRHGEGRVPRGNIRPNHTNHQS